MILRNLMVGVSFLLAGAAVAQPPDLGSVVSGTSFTTAGGQNLNFGQLRGEVVVVTYWASDCVACEDQVKALDYYYRQRKDLGLRVLAVSTDAMTKRQLKHAFSGKMVHPVAEIGSPFQPLDSLPTTYVIDRSGHVRYANSGMIGVEQLNQVLVPLLKQPQP